MKLQYSITLLSLIVPNEANSTRKVRGAPGNRLTSQIREVKTMNMVMRGTLAKLRSECEGLKSEIYSIKDDISRIKETSTGMQNDQAQSDDRSSHDRNMRYLQTTFEMIENNIRRLDNDVQEIRDYRELNQDKQEKDTGRLAGALDSLMTEIDLLSDEAGSEPFKFDEKQLFYWNEN